MATATAAAPMAISQNLLLTLPPPTRSDFRGRTGGEYPLLLTDFQATRFRFGSVSPAPLTMQSGRSGGTGRRAGLKIRFPSGSVGSIPTFGTLERGDTFDDACAGSGVRTEANRQDAHNA